MMTPWTSRYLPRNARRGDRKHFTTHTLELQVKIRGQRGHNGDGQMIGAV